MIKRFTGMLFVTVLCLSLTQTVYAENEKDTSSTFIIQSLDNTQEENREDTAANTEVPDTTALSPDGTDPAIQSSYDIDTSSSEDNTLGSYIYYRQGDPAWASSGLSMSSAGCGPTAVAVVVSNLLPENQITPVDAARWGRDNGYYSGGGSKHEMIPAIGAHYGLTVMGLGNDANAVKDALKNGGMVIGLMGPGHFTRGGHFIAILEIDETDQVLVADVATKKRSQRYDLSYMIDQSKSAGAGGPFWAYFRPDTGRQTSETSSQNTTAGTSGQTAAEENTEENGNTQSTRGNTDENRSESQEQNTSVTTKNNIPIDTEKKDITEPTSIVIDTKWKEKELESITIKQTSLDEDGKVKKLNGFPVYDYRVYHKGDTVKIKGIESQIVKLTVFGAYLVDVNGDPVSLNNTQRIQYHDLKI